MGITRYDEVGYWSELKLDIVRKYTQASNAAVAAAYRERLQQVAGFEYVPAPMPMRNTRGAIVYYLFFASPNRTGAKIVSDIFNRYRDRGTV